MLRDFIQQSWKQWWKYFVLLSLVIFVLFLLSLALGSVVIPAFEALKIVSGFTSQNEAWQEIILNFRLPKALTAILVGAALGISGLQMQTFFRNPLAGPFVLGISSGASLGAALLILGGASLGLHQLGGQLFASAQVIAAALGAILVMIAVISVARSLRDAMSLLIVGLMFSSTTGALVSIMQYFSQAEDIQAYMLWSFGSLGGLSWEEMQIFAPVITIGLLLSFASAKQLNMLLLGEQYARSMGLNIKRARLTIIISTCLLAGSVTAFCGPIAFIGIAVPHMVRMLFPTSNHLLLIPLVCLMGAGTMLFCDLIAQLPGTSQLLPINAVTSLIGGPVVIWIIVSKRNLRYSL
ncbi:MAG: iron ABC transporter permease [Imperialibacter sp.]